MFTQISSGGIRAVSGYVVSVEADVSDGLPAFSISGQLATEVRESQDRVRTALRNSGFRLPAKKITVSLSPAGVRKGGTAFDLPIALAILGAFGMVNVGLLDRTMMIGELGLDGRVKPVNGVLVLAAEAAARGFCRLILPWENCREGRAAGGGLEIVGVRSLESLASALASEAHFSHFLEQAAQEETASVPFAPVRYEEDYRDVNGQLVLRRAAEIAAAGMHGLLMSGGAGTGKTMVARRIPGILPSLTREEDIEISKIYSISGLLPPGSSLLSRRPFRSPHHTISPYGLVGGGSLPKPGELSLASGGVLFLDELPLFGRSSIEALRQPLEDRSVTITRGGVSYEFPADVMLVAAMNPCPCGFYPDRNRCRCTPAEIRRYLGRLSRPIMDRFDLCVQASPVTFEELEQRGEAEGAGEASDVIRKRVEGARRCQEKRFRGSKIRFNSHMGQRELKEFCRLGQKERQLAAEIYRLGGVSARGYHKVLRVARTIADLEEKEQIGTAHLAEAFGYRTLEGILWEQER